MKITAKLTNPAENSRNLSGDKELVRAWSVVTISKNRICEPVQVRWWMSRGANASRVFCSIWCAGNDTHCAGHGYASGYGYDKCSAALQSAINAAGIELSEPIDGVGDLASEAACRAIARALGFRGKTCLISHA